ncbi:MAG: hypothetical protein ACE5I5_06450 [Candidatus Heimdallarchaeota archaeon]
MVVIPVLVFLPLLIIPYIVERLPLPNEKRTRAGELFFYAGIYFLLAISYWAAASAIITHIFYATQDTPNSALVGTLCSLSPASIMHTSSPTRHERRLDDFVQAPASTGLAGLRISPGAKKTNS